MSKHRLLLEHLDLGPRLHLITVIRSFLMIQIVIDFHLGGKLQLDRIIKARTFDTIHGLVMQAAQIFSYLVESGSKIGAQDFCLLYLSFLSAIIAAELTVHEFFILELNTLGQVWGSLSI